MAKQKLEKLIEWKSELKSWYPAPMLTKEQYRYLKTIEAIYTVQSPDGEYIPIRLTNHQAEYHASDIAICGNNAKNRIVVKSRNTSFTTNSIISMLNACYNFRNQIKPIVRINEGKAKELIDQYKELIKHMSPVKLDNEDYYPFNPKTVNMNNAFEITIPDRNISIKAYAASGKAADNIRGNRINDGLNDECNFESDFLNIHAALKQAARGASLKTGKRSFQYSYGTTRKGRTTAFNLWYEDQEDKINKGLLNNIQVFKWPVFDPLLYGPKDIEKSILDVPGLVPIVPWHTLEHLENERVSNYNQFIEEYLAGLVDSDDNFYPTQAIEQCEQRPKLSNGKFMNDLKHWEIPKNHGEYYMSVDPAANTDFFAIVIVERVYVNGLPRYIERYLYYKQKVELPQMENKVIDIINVWKDYGLKRCIIDGNGMGFQLSETCKKVCGKKIVDIIRGNMSIKFKGRRKMPLNEFCHTRLKRFLLKKRIELIKDDVQRIHFSGWNYDYKCDHTKEYGHGDIVDALSKCILPDNYRRVQDEEVLEIVSEDKPKDTKQEKKLHVPKVYTLLEKLEMFKKNKGGNIGQHYGYF